MCRIIIKLPLPIYTGGGYCMPITFSEQFNISKEVLEITGVFDVILDIDTRVFIDPALLELCTEPEFLDARKKVEKYFSDIITLLRHSKSQTDMYRKRAERMLTFTELSGTCFGYSQNGTGGNAIGSVLRKTILNTIQDLMTEGIVRSISRRNWLRSRKRSNNIYSP